MVKLIEETNQPSSKVDIEPLFGWPYYLKTPIALEHELRYYYGDEGDLNFSAVSEEDSVSK